MQSLSRRIFGRAAVMLPIGLVVASCTPEQTLQFSTIGTTVANDATTLANGLSGVLPALLSALGANTKVAGTVNSIISGIQSAATALGTVAAGTGQSLATQIASGVSALTNAVSGFTIPSWVTTVIQAAGTLLPVILSVAGVALAGPVGDPKAIVQARAVLLAAAR